MKRILITIFLFTLFIRCHNQEQPKPVNVAKPYINYNIEKMEIQYIPFYSMYVIDVNCDIFDGNDDLKEGGKIMSTKNIQRINAIYSDILELKSSPELNGIDARMKLTIYFNNNQKEFYCIGVNDVFFNNQYYPLSDSLRLKLLRITNQELELP